MKKAMRSTIIVLIAIMTLAIATVTVSAASGKVTSVDIKKSSTTLAVGKSEGLAISYAYQGARPSTSGIKWTSSNTTAVKVTNGTVIAKKAGTSTVTVTFGGQKDTCKVTVKATPDRWINANDAYTELNKYRKAKKMKALKKDASLEKIAKIRAEEMAKTGKFSHTRPNGKSGLTLIKTKKAKGENIAMGQKTCAQVSKAWYNSKGHRANMLRKKFTRVGIACYEYNGVTYWAQVFSSN
jgi:uncharacterized protein YkwD